MKRIALVAALAAAYAAPAFAQSNVTIYGRMNTSIERQKNGDQSAMWVMQNNRSRIGFRGTEDLGGGLKALFLLEHGLNSDTGAATGAMWGRGSWVGLEGGFGTLRLGHFLVSDYYYATADYVSMHNHDTGTSADALWAGPVTWNGRMGDTISYTTPTFSGFNAAVQFGLKETPSGGDNALSLAANYDMGPLHLGAGMEKLGDDKSFGIRALYELGAFTFGGYYERADFDVLGKRNNFRLSGMYTMGASEFHLNAGVAGDWDNIDNSGAKQFTVGYNYNLSKRTKLYAFYTKISADAAAVNPAGAQDDFSSFALGIRHNF